MGLAYLYGVIRSSDEVDLGVPGVDGADLVHIVAHDGLGAVMSDYQGQAFGALSKENLVRGLLAHQRVIEGVMGDHPVLPVKFGTLLDGRREVLELLNQAHAQFVAALAAIRDKVELEVAVTWDINRVLQEISQEAEVVRAREALMQQAQLTVGDRIHLGQLVKECVDRRRDGYRQRMLSLLQPLSVESAVNPLVSDELVMNVAFLVERARQTEFEEGVQELDRLFQNEITFRVIGPLPPYSFSSVEVTRITPEQVEEARRALGLGGAASQAEVRQAYRRLAAEEHRNRRPAAGPVNDRLARLRRASELLVHYCRAREEAQKEGQDGQDAKAAGRLFLVAINRRASDEIDPARFGATITMAAGG